MVRTLCIGNSTSDTDNSTTDLAKQNSSGFNRGLVSSVNDSITGDGYWHTSLADVGYTGILELAQKFDCVHFLDQQDINDQTYKLYKELEPLVSVVCERDDMFDDLSSKQAYWHEQFKTNPSICAVPFLASSPDICGAISVPVLAQEQETMKHNMIAGIKNSQCSVCYSEEGSPENYQPRKPKWGELNSFRINESLHWISTLDLQTTDDLQKLSTTYYYRIKCSELDSLDVTKLANSCIHVDIVEDCTQGCLADFLKKCVQASVTEFRLTFSTNTKIVNTELLDMLDNFASVTVKIQLDAVGKANNYIHWGTDFNQVLATVDELKQRGHRVNFVNQISIYNIARLDELLEFSDKVTISTGILSPYNFPDKKQILAVLDKCKQTLAYKTSVFTRSAIDELYKTFYLNHYQRYTSKQSIEQLELFVKYTDSIDETRGSKLRDYIPELDAIRRIK